MNGVLIDTHVLIWWLEKPAYLSSEAREAITERRVMVSVASIWEMVIKRAVRRLDTPNDLAEMIAANAFDVLPIHAGHALAIAELPALHGDPFDRMLVAQARLESLIIVTRDPEILKYDVRCIRA